MLLINFLIKAGLECSPFLKECNFLNKLCWGGDLHFLKQFQNYWKSEQLNGTGKMFERGGRIKRSKLIL